MAYNEIEPLRKDHHDHAYSDNSGPVRMVSSWPIWGPAGSPVLGPAHDIHDQRQKEEVISKAYDLHRF